MLERRLASFCRIGGLEDNKKTGKKTVTGKGASTKAGIPK
jgi:hypothetical protein